MRRPPSCQPVPSAHRQLVWQSLDTEPFVTRLGNGSVPVGNSTVAFWGLQVRYNVRAALEALGLAESPDANKQVPSSCGSVVHYTRAGDSQDRLLHLF